MSAPIAHISIPGNFGTVGQRIKPSRLMCRVSSATASTTRYRRASVQCHVKTCGNGQVITRRRSGNYKPPLWDFDFIQSLRSEYTEEMHLKRASELMVEVGIMLNQHTNDDVRLLEFIDDLQRLCVSYHFQDKINQILSRIHQEEAGHKHSERDLYSTALQFRLLRQHGFPVSQAHIPIPKKPTITVNDQRIKPASKLMRRSVSSATASSTHHYRSASFRCHVVKTRDHAQVLTRRRSGNYKPAIWDFDFIQSLSSEYTEERHLERASELMVDVEMMLEAASTKEDDVQVSEFIDDLQRLCISYHFHDKINQILKRIYEEAEHKHSERDLYSTALQFRLLRQHGFPISEGVFDCFKDNNCEFKASLVENTKGLLQLYEASFLSTEGEKTLELAKELATKLLKKQTHVVNDEYLSLLVHNALELPLHWRTQRPNSRWFISAYERRPYNMNPIVLELAKLDFNIVQAAHQQELKQVSRWWKQTLLAEKLPFARDRLVECYLWTTGGFVFESKYGYARIMATKVNALITIIDDMFDVYGTLEELQLFNNAIQRWDTEAMEELPDYMKVCYLALNNFIDEMAYDVLKQQGILVIPHLRKSWSRLCEAYLQEAKWYSMGYTPTLEEYISNAWISVSAPLMLTHAFFLVTNSSDQKEAVETLSKHHNIIRCSAMILRLANDLGTSPDEMKRGDVPKAIQCYMHETGADIEEAQEYVSLMIHETWKEMNEELRLVSPFEDVFVRVAADLGRMAQYMYEHGDGHGIHFPQMKDRMSTLLFEPISIA